VQAGTRRILVRLGVSLALAAAFVWWLTNQGIRMIPSAADFSRIAPWALPIYAANLFAFHFLRAWRWEFLLRPIQPVPTKKVILVSLVGYLAVLILPLRTGELARPVLIRRHAGIPMSTALGTVAVERVLDGLMVSAALTICLLVVPIHPGPYLWMLRLAPLGVFATALAVLVLVLRHPAWTARVAGGAAGLLSKRLVEPVGRAVRGVAHGLKAMPDRNALFRFLAVSLTYWSANAVGIYLLANGCGIDLGFFEAVGVMGILAVGVMLPAGPGFFGSFQAAALVALGFFVSVESVAAGASIFIFVLYAGQVLFTVVLGLLAVAWGGVSLHGVAQPGLADVASDELTEWP
jgi:uncharacterized protein (TIRG00374 family)